MQDEMVSLYVRDQVLDQIDEGLVPESKHYLIPFMDFMAILMLSHVKSVFSAKLKSLSPNLNKSDPQTTYGIISY